MKYEKIDAELFVTNRKRFYELMKPNSVALFFSNDVMPTGADGTMEWHQNPDFFHLSGIDQEESILMLFPDAFNEQWREILFVRETSETIKIWEGYKYSKEQGREQAGIQNVQFLDQFQRLLRAVLATNVEHVYLNDNEHARANVQTQTRESRWNKWFMETYPLYNIQRSAPLMHAIRSVKQPKEIELIQRACDITKMGIERILRFVKPGVMEYEIEAELSHEFIRNRSKGFAYHPIIASGINNCILHYTDNNRVCNDGDMLLMDVGAEYGNYASDLTRTIPVNGRFTDRQRAVYNAVLSVKNDATKLLTPGTYLKDYHVAVGELMDKQLVDLGLITMEDIKNQDPNWPAHKKYFMHGTSHFLGLDVHDVGHWTTPIAPGHVYTVEPGIYIPEEGFGVRLEDDVLITENGFKNLMGEIPIEADHIEELMNKDKVMA